MKTNNMPNYITKTNKSVIPSINKSVLSHNPQVSYSKQFDEEAIVRKILSYIKVPEAKDGIPGKHGKSVLLEDVLSSFLEKINDKSFKLKTENIQGLEDELRSIRQYVANYTRGKLGGGEGEWKVKNLSGAIDGSRTAFTVSGERPATNSHHVYLNYQEQNPLDDYVLTWSGGTTTVTYDVAPDASLAGRPHYIRYM